MTDNKWQNNMIKLNLILVRRQGELYALYFILFFISHYWERSP